MVRLLVLAALAPLLVEPSLTVQLMVRAVSADASKRGRPIMGSAIVLPMKADDADKWSGQIYNAEDGKTYSGSFALSGASKADLKGCVAIICKSKTWTRTN